MSILSRRLLMVAAAAGAALALASCNKAGGGGAASTEAMTMGKADAPVHIEEYASTTCSHCGRFAIDVFPAFKAKYIDTGKVRWTYHEFLTPPEAVAAAGVLVARCAGKDKYFSVIDALFHSQEEMYRTGDARGTLLKVAQSAGMTEAQFNACVQDEAAAKALNDRVQAAQKDRNITSTPTFYVNGKKLKEGELSMQELEAAVAGAGK
ncbi:MAG: DsbA family protein [Phenylobacterium sp.]|jgi:protein-disulfide isomerase|uniref:thioredoxin domain-containing protein n=1 Tax=unclassified Phenylobacterium TaxID=2640670 RepID=UPI0008AF10C0|nr:MULTISPECIES: thioredoxin domain-containing protein [unclassified Phenylobacterium]MBJ7411385.1 DsbA family protein [Phenylobacterium sp.]OHB29346.1 MAG: disulfide bond formation protein DsbA [Phenylobacterium sp. RIFCSPHIGHO2_01_FULL_69_31]